MKNSRHSKPGAYNVAGLAWACLQIGLIDLALVATTAVMLATMVSAAKLTIFCFHVVFVLLTFGAFFWKFRAFVWRAVFWVAVDTAVVLLAAVFGSLPYDELIEIPLLSTILVLVFMIARRRAEAQARLQEQDKAFLEAILGNMEDAVVACDARGRLAFSNPAARTIHGLPEGLPGGLPEELPLERWTDHYELRTETGATVDEADIPILRALRGERIKDEEFVISTKDNPARYLLVSGNRMQGSLEQTLGAIVVMRDITERKLAERRLREVQEDERERIARDLHDAVLQDLSWAMRKIEYDRKMGIVDLKNDLASEQVVPALRRAVQGVRNSIYDLLPRDASKRTFAELLESALDLNREISPEIEFEAVIGEFPHKLPQPASAEVMKIIQEALVNARRHSSASRVRVTLDTEGDQFVVCVEDDGRGLEPHTIPGLGMAGMRERAERLGGSVEIHSRELEGTQVCFSAARDLLIRSQQPQEKLSWVSGKQPASS